MLYIFHNDENGLYCESIDNGDFDDWVMEHTNGIKLECHPKFVNSMPTEMSDPREFFIIEGKPVVPIAVKVVRTYTLP